MSSDYLNPGWQVQVVDHPGRAKQKVYLYRYVGNKTEYIRHTGEIAVAEEGAAYDDDYYFALMSRDQLQAFANALTEKGIRTTNDSKNEGILQATNAHLEDMRRLVFKDKK